jgi:hypothetical protein
MDSEQCLSVTAGSEYPDGILQMLQLFRSRRTGDLVISAGEGVVFAEDAMSAGSATHGSLRAEHMMVPFASSVPGGTGARRTSDIFALALALLGIDPAHSLDGEIPTGIELQRVEAAGSK